MDDQTQSGSVFHPLFMVRNKRKCPAGVREEGVFGAGRPLVPKKRQELYLVDSLNPALRRVLPFYPVFGNEWSPNWTQVLRRLER